MSHLRLRPVVVVGALLALAGSANAFAAGKSRRQPGLRLRRLGVRRTHDFIEVFNRGTVSEPLAWFSFGKRRSQKLPKLTVPKNISGSPILD